MKDTKSYEEQSEVLLVSTKQLCKMLSLGETLAAEVGTAAKAKVQVGSRVCWNIKKIERYIDDISK